MGDYIAVVGGMNVDIGGRPARRPVLRDSNPGRVSIRPGGVGRNIAHDLRLLGMEVRMLSAVGDDGHGALLLRSCAACIQETLGGEENRQCFRFGGDEFAAFWVDVPASEVDAALRRFAEAQTARKISVSVGHAHSDDLSETTAEELFERADKVMYEEKAKHYKKIVDGIE